MSKYANGFPSYSYTNWTMENWVKNDLKIDLRYSGSNDFRPKPHETPYGQALANDDIPRSDVTDKRRRHLMTNGIIMFVVAVLGIILTFFISHDNNREMRLILLLGAVTGLSIIGWQYWETRQKKIHWGQWKRNTLASKKERALYDLTVVMVEHNQTVEFLAASIELADKNDTQKMQDLLRAAQILEKRKAAILLIEGNPELLTFGGVAGRLLTRNADVGPQELLDERIEDGKYLDAAFKELERNGGKP